MATCGKVSNKLYFESKLESKKNQNVNTVIKISSGVDNFYRKVIRDKI